MSCFEDKLLLHCSRQKEWITVCIVMPVIAVLNTSTAFGAASSAALLIKCSHCVLQICLICQLHSKAIHLLVIAVTWPMISNKVFVLVVRLSLLGCNSDIRLLPNSVEAVVAPIVKPLLVRQRYRRC
jgi:hypothetical protein